MFRLSTYLLFIFFAFAECSDQIKDIVPAARHKLQLTKNNPSVAICDVDPIDKPKIKNYKKAWSVWLETTSLDWFLENRQSAWREAKAWHFKTYSIDKDPIVKCLCEEKRNIFLYLPDHYYIKERNGNEYFKFFIVNNSNDTVPLPRIDAVINNISSSVSYGDTSKPWYSFQETTKEVECGNSFWTMKLPPKNAIEAQMEADDVNLGDTLVDYRVELALGKRKIVSNAIKISLMKKQLPYLGKSINESTYIQIKNKN